MVKRKFTARRDDLGEQLQEMRRQLEGCRVCVTVAVNALRHQNADIDEDIATALQRGASHPLSDQIERIAALMAKLKCERRLSRTELCRGRGAQKKRKNPRR